jgi:hypothetical protein
MGAPVGERRAGCDSLAPFPTLMPSAISLRKARMAPGSAAVLGSMLRKSLLRGAGAEQRVKSWGRFAATERMTSQPGWPGGGKGLTPQ